jgi:hypothetical protein
MPPGWRLGTSIGANRMALLRVIVVLIASLLALQGGALAQTSKVYRVGLVGAGAPEFGLLGPAAVDALPSAVTSPTRTLCSSGARGKARLSVCPGSSTNSSPTMST